MKIGGLLRTIRGRKHAARFTAAVAAVLLTVSLFVSLQPCCGPYTSLSAPHSAQSGSFAHEGDSHAQGTQAAGLAGFQDCCGHSASSGPELAKAMPAIPGRGSSQTDAAVSTIFIASGFWAMPRMVLPSIYALSPPPFHIYLRFLHLLI